MIRCDTCLIALQIADREDNNCPSCKDYRIPSMLGLYLGEKLKKANAKALAKHQKFQESDWQEQQTKDIKEMDDDGIDHPFKEDDDYADRGLHRSNFIDDKYI